MPRIKRALLRSLRRADTLLVFLALIIIFFLYEKYGIGESTPPQRTSAPALLAPDSPTDFGADDVENAVPVADRLSDERVNALLREMPPAVKSKPVKFLMLNVHNYFVKEDHRRSHYRISYKSNESKEAVAELIAASQASMVGLIEMGGPEALKDLQERLQRKGAKYPYAKILLRQGEDRALAFLSQYPLVQDHSKPHCPLLGSKRQKMLRGILDVTVCVDGNRYFRIIGAHLKSRVADDPAAATARRTHEAQTLARYIQLAVRRQPSVPLLVYGDWNDGPADASLAILKQGVSADSALSRVRAEDSRGQTWTIYYAPAEEYCTFDQIYVNKVLRSRRGRKSASGIMDIPAAAVAGDHRAVWCELR